MQFLPSNGCVNTTVWMHQMDPDKVYWEKARRELHKNATSHIEQILEKHPTKQQLYGQRPPISKTIPIKWTRHAGHCWRSKNELISDVLQWTPSHGWASLGRPTGTCLQQLCADTGCCLEDLPEAMDDRDE